MSTDAKGNLNHYAVTLTSYQFYINKQASYGTAG